MKVIDGQGTIMETTNPLYKEPHPIFFSYITSGSAQMFMFDLTHDDWKKKMGEVAESMVIREEVLVTDGMGFPTLDENGESVSNVMGIGPLKPNTKYRSVLYDWNADKHWNQTAIIRVLDKEVVE